MVKKSGNKRFNINNVRKNSSDFFCQAMKKFWHSGQQESRSEEGMESAKYTTKYTTALQSGMSACHQNA